MSARLAKEGTVDYTNHRRGDRVASSFRYTISPDSALAEPGTLEFFLVERYLLFANSPRGLRRGQVHHSPYPVAPAEAPILDTRLLALNGFEQPARMPDHVCGSRVVNVLIYPLR
jgi:uncharacterized protein YqjF (DUF2071 family)